MQANPICFMLLKQEMPCARILAFDNAGNSIAARMAMMAMTTSNSISVKPEKADGAAVEQHDRCRETIIFIWMIAP